MSSLSSQAVVNQLVPPSRAYNLEFYTDVQDLSYLQYHLDRDPCSAKYRKLTKELCEVIEDYGLVNFTNIGYSGISENVLAASNDGTSTEDGEQARRASEDHQDNPKDESLAEKAAAQSLL
ncbi:hypothetical protein AMTR_s00052p00145550 [Amborella trichopoda]|uniref:Uncharacterized protein n=1 Tax=Amborella trichopoda TaxID=13333 RepID=U5CT18_AMBTC|nr:hypothetical protein AMTR_s00052p00145550 [Amborella trichopoda]